MGSHSKDTTTESLLFVIGLNKDGERLGDSLWFILLRIIGQRPLVILLCGSRTPGTVQKEGPPLICSLYRSTRSRAMHLKDTSIMSRFVSEILLVGATSLKHCIPQTSDDSQQRTNNSLKQQDNTAQSLGKHDETVVTHRGRQRGGLPREVLCFFLLHANT